MKIETVSISKIKINPDNPRVIKDDKFKKLVQSIKDFPEMLSIRPVVVNSEMMVLGGNMRLKACKSLGMKEVPVIKTENLTQQQQKEFIIKDNVGFGQWNWDSLSDAWDSNLLESWGVDVPSFNQFVKSNEMELKGFKQVHILLSFRPETMIDAEPFLNDLKKITDIEYEQSAN